MNGDKDQKKDDDSINALIQNYNLVELLEKEPLRIAFDRRIKEFEKLSLLDQNSLYPMYKDYIQISGPESWSDLYSKKDNEEANRDLYLRLKFKNLNELREIDA